MLLNLLMGLAAGTLCALGGAIKDSPHEGFKPETFMRSPLLGIATGALTIPFTHHWFVAFCVAGYLERVCVEGWKIVRRQTPGKHAWTYSEWPWMWAGQRPIEKQPPGTPE